MPLWGSSKNKSQPLATTDKWAPLAPSAPGANSSNSRFSSVLKPSKPGYGGSNGSGGANPMIGRYPENVILKILDYLPIPDLPHVARVNRAFSRAVRDERCWEKRCKFLRIEGVAEDATKTAKDNTLLGVGKFPSPRKSMSGGNKRDSIDDDFGDFSTDQSKDGDVFEDVDFGDFSGSMGNRSMAPPGGGGLNHFGTMEKSLLDFDDMPLPSKPIPAGNGTNTRTSGFFAFPAATTTPATTKSMASNGFWSSTPATLGPLYLGYKMHHQSLIPLCKHLRSSPSPSSTLALLFPPSPNTSLPPPLSAQADKLLVLLLFLSPRLQPLHDWGFLRQALLAAADRFDSTCLVAFEVSDTKKDEKGMRIAAESSWKVWEAGGGSRDQWECGRVWVEKREVFYESSKWDSLENIVKTVVNNIPLRQLDFTPMDAFIYHALETFRGDAELAVRIFPEQARVVLSFCDRVAMDVIGEYISPLLNQARAISQDLFLQATAASFVQAWKLVDVAMEVLGPKQTVIPRTKIEDVIYRMFEEHMDEYLDEETEKVKVVLEGICRAWEQQLGAENTAGTGPTPATPTFLTSSNPDQVKRNVLAGFKDVLLLPVTIVPRTVTYGVNAIVSGGSSAVSGLAMLNPQKWSTATPRIAVSKDDSGRAVVLPDVPTVEDFELGNEKTDVIDEKVNHDHDDNSQTQDVPPTPPIRIAQEEHDPDTNWGDDIPSTTSIPPTPAESIKSPNLTVPTSASASSINRSLSGTGTTTGQSTPSGLRTPTTPIPGTPSLDSAKSFDRLQLLVSLDTALELIHADRESLKRCETFAKYPGKYGHKVREAIEEIFILMLKAAGDRHIAPGFRIATNAMGSYKPAEHEETTSVAPLLQFFELVHIGDTIQSMVQVYFDKELSLYVDKTDFLNAVMREKKRFESVLDDAVAAGLNAGIEVLMNQVEHIIQVKTGPREYYPDEGTPLELGPTQGCREAIACLEMHCNLLRGSTSKEVLEVFYQEVGIRLQAILQRHLKRQIISLEGGFQIIADLNAYHAFVASLKQQRITEDFANLKMLGHVYIVSDAKDLAQIVRDVTRYGGTFRPEDIYEFIQRRADWKKIEKTVDKAMYALSVKDDCVIM